MDPLTPINTECGIPIRNITVMSDIPQQSNMAPYETFTFEALLGGTWRQCHNPCGNWAYVKDYNPSFVHIGIWELREITKKYNILPTA
jgi:hypothetical protein